MSSLRDSKGKHTGSRCKEIGCSHQLKLYPAPRYGLWRRQKTTDQQTDHQESQDHKYTRYDKAHTWAVAETRRALQRGRFPREDIVGNATDYKSGMNPNGNPVHSLNGGNCDSIPVPFVPHSSIVGLRTRRVKEPAFMLQTRFVGRWLDTSKLTSTACNRL